MKIVGISILLLLSLMGVSISFDTLVGNSSWNTSIKNTINPFYVMETPELVLFYLFLLLTLVTPVRLFFQKKKQKQRINSPNNSPLKK